MISIIIPTYNEEESIGNTIKWIRKDDTNHFITEIIVVDGGSADKTKEEVEKNAGHFVVSPKKGRAIQMNYGAAIAKGSILYFLHADTFPPKNFAHQILQAYQNGYHSGCFRLDFNHDHWFLKANCWFTRFDVNNFRFGDQSLFVTKKVFAKVGGFNKKMIVLEDQDIICNIRKYSRFKVMEESVTSSARKYMLNGIYKTQTIYYLIYMMYKLGFSQQKLVSTYKSFIKQNKI
jgi:rSAM/selenodomain-associated transferase 2